ncbi:hypothetical protein [Campylobacter fetus]|uniref:hypothetical protein n=1 Tax=Campylobacter fetus TaxID=196 RepID=UPI000FCBEBA9|nr:hypothetical protein [Campylobacter fetus]QQF52656.1 hypothetical protein HHI31_07420 [Campylobacter fetus subsp. venerealis]RUT49481.1 hypothetical protein BWK67_07980 [Campylobacter fetus]RUT49740.1 hypothetical protein BWK51_07960 [Campylobacter fetus]
MFKFLTKIAIFGYLISIKKQLIACSIILLFTLIFCIYLSSLIDNLELDNLAKFGLLSLRAVAMLGAILGCYFVFKFKKRVEFEIKSENKNEPQKEEPKPKQNISEFSERELELIKKKPRSKSEIIMDNLN